MKIQFHGFGEERAGARAVGSNMVQKQHYWYLSPLTRSWPLSPGLQIRYFSQIICEFPRRRDYVYFFKLPYTVPNSVAHTTVGTHKACLGSSTKYELPAIRRNWESGSQRSLLEIRKGKGTQIKAFWKTWAIFPGGRERRQTPKSGCQGTNKKHHLREPPTILISSSVKGKRLLWVVISASAQVPEKPTH